jgi:hypothetical protein
MDGLMGLISIVILGSGLYILYAWYNMKVNGEVSETLLLGKGYEIKNCKDKEAFMRKTSPAVIILGVIVTISGGITCLRHFLMQDNELLVFLDPFVNAFVLIAIIVFGVYTVRVKKIYF